MTSDERGRALRSTSWGGALALALIVSALPAAATDYFADNSCAIDGNGLSAVCAASAGAPGARNSGAGLQAAIDASACGDTIYIGHGSGIYTNDFHGGNEYANKANFTVKKSCTAAAPLTIRGANPANRPVLCQNATCTDGGVDKATIAVTGSAYVKLQYMIISGAVFIEGAQHNQAGMEASYLDISGGARCDGNYSVLYTDDSRVWIHHNLLHNLNATSCNQRAGLRMFGSYGSIIEYNTIVEGTGSSMDRGGMDLKDCTANVTVRYNVLRGSGRTNSQDASCQPGSPFTSPGTNNRFYGNVFVGAGAQQMTGDMDSTLDFFNNTVVAGALDWYGDPQWGPIRGSNVHDNLIVNGGGSLSGTNVNLGIRQESWPYHSSYAWDYNIYYSGSGFYGNGATYHDLPSWRTASGLDTHSQELSCAFVQTTDPNATNFYKLAPGTSCLTDASRVGRVEAGAYGVASCVGNLCSGAPAVCGNNLKDLGETCDGTDLSGATCLTQGFGGGVLACNATCSGYVTTACTGDVTPPVLSNGLPAGALAQGTTQATIGVTTSENATCKYATTPGVAYAAMTGTFTTTGGTTQSTGVTGLQDGQSYAYYVRCQDAAANADLTDYPIAFNVAAASAAASGGSLECTNWQTNHPTWIWCDDFENDAALESSYMDVDRRGGLMGVASDQAFGGSHSLKWHYTAGATDIGYLFRSFGRNPRQQTSNPTTDFTEVYWRVYVRHQPGWTDGTSKAGDVKYTRATMYVDANRSQGMIAHIWTNGAVIHGLQQSPVRCVSGSTVVCTSGYNDFAHMIYEGDVSGPQSITASGDTGAWHCLEGHVKLNTPGSSDGVFQTWVDNSLDMNDSTINWRGSYTGYGINTISLEGVWNGGAPATQDRWFDNFVISRDRIGCSGGTPPPTTVSTPTGLHRSDTR